MAFRSDVTVDFSLSPRIIEVAAPSITITVQDLLDTLRLIEDQPINMTYPKLINAGGKEVLTAISQVGITATLQNARVKFANRAGPGTTRCSTTDGNLVAVGADGVTPIPADEPSTFVHMTIELSTSPSIINANVGDLWTASIENGRTAEEMWRLMFSALVGKVSGAGTNNMLFRDDADTKDRIDVIVDPIGNRTGFNIKDGS